MYKFRKRDISRVYSIVSRIGPQYLLLVANRDWLNLFLGSPKVPCQRWHDKDPSCRKPPIIDSNAALTSNDDFSIGGEIHQT